MIELYYWTTPNGHKITIFLEGSRASLYDRACEHRRRASNSSRSFWRYRRTIASRPSSITTRKAAARRSRFSNPARSCFISPKRPGVSFPRDLRGRVEVLQWLFWQMAGLGPMAGQNHHFSQYAPEKIPYAIDRYVKETNRLYGVLNKRLADRPFVAGDYSIADMAAYPWIVPYERQGPEPRRFPAPEALVRGDRGPPRRCPRLRARQGNQYGADGVRRGQKSPLRSDCCDREKLSRVAGDHQHFDLEVLRIVQQ